MAINIIDTRPNTAVIKQAVCRNCGVTLEYTPADVSQKYIRDYGGGGDTVRWIKCPACAGTVYVK